MEAAPRCGAGRGDRHHFGRLRGCRVSPLGRERERAGRRLYERPVVVGIVQPPPVVRRTGGLLPLPALFFVTQEANGHTAFGGQGIRLCLSVFFREWILGYSTRKARRAHRQVVPFEWPVPYYFCAMLEGESLAQRWHTCTRLGAR